MKIVVIRSPKVLAGFFRVIFNIKKEEPAPEPTVKLCPHCFSEINYKATKCPHCTSELIEEVEAK